MPCSINSKTGLTQDLSALISIEQYKQLQQISYLLLYWFSLRDLFSGSKLHCYDFHKLLQLLNFISEENINL